MRVAWRKVSRPKETEMLSSEMAKSQITDRVRDAEADRTSRATRGARKAEARSATRRILQTAAAAAAWPFKR
jgi:hypothetical protein